MEIHYVVPANTRIGHVHLNVADLKRSIKFYCDLLGLEIITVLGEEAAFISAGGYHHHIGLNTGFSEGSAKPDKHSAGLFHTAIVYPTKKDLAVIYNRLSIAQYPFTGFADHGINLALYLDDPDGNGVELFWDKPEEEWPRNKDGSMATFNNRLDLQDLMNEL